ncbi:MAG TPA: hypothetical protein VEB21_08230, partial [Terriglobales bacterium]|nr:hypothetical protein [Terriglobales bacterium]
MRLLSAAVLSALLIAPWSRPAAGQCRGDCNADGAVTVDELITGVSIALGTAALDQCRAIDGNVDASVTVDEIIAAVTTALDGCPDAAARVLAFSRAGQMASFDVSPPW